MDSVHNKDLGGAEGMGMEQLLVAQPQQRMFQVAMQVRVRPDVATIHEASRSCNFNEENDERRARCAGKVGTIIDTDQRDQSVKVRVMVTPGSTEEVWFGAGAVAWHLPEQDGARQESSPRSGLMLTCFCPEQCHPANWAEMCKLVPFQAQQILISWIFIFASISLFLDFVSLQSLVKCSTTVCGSSEKYFKELNNWFGTISCVWWFTGFVILQHWLARLPATKEGQFGCLLKLVASVFFNMQPMTGIAGTRLNAGLAWSNLIGILLFHSGNLVSCMDFYRNPPPGSNDQGRWFEHGNLPITGMWIYQLATWFLVVGNLMTCDWSGNGPVDSSQWLATDTWTVKMCQYAGSLLLLLGSIVYGMWCNAFRSLAL